MRDHLRSAIFIWRVLVARYPTETLLVVVVSAVTYVAEPLAAYWLKLLVDGALAGDQSGAVWAAALLGVTFTVSSSVDVVGRMTAAMLGEKATMDIDRDFIEMTSGIPGLEHHERADYANEMELLRSERGQLVNVAKSLVTAVGLSVRLAAVAILLASVTPILLFLPLLGIPSLLLVPKAHHVQRRASEATAERARLAHHAFDLLIRPNTAKEIRILGGQHWLQSLQQRLSREVANERVAAGVQAQAIQATGDIIFTIGYLAVIVLVTVRAINGQATVGDTLMAVTLGGQVSGVAGETQRLFHNGLGSLRAAKRYRWLVDYAKQASLPPADPAPVPARITNGLRLEEVTFRYPGTDVDVLHDLTIDIPAGATVAIVGENGAGKTTLVKLLGKYYPPTSGRITLDEVDITRFDTEQWRARLSAAFQDYMRFEFTAQQTVGLGDLPRIDNTVAVHAGLERAHGTDVLAALAHGLDSQLGRSWADGAELSGGQWQKLALARAMMRDQPLVLFLDEPTAALDAHTEHALFERYTAAANTTAAETGTITVLVSHRFSTVRMADLIIVLNNNHIEEHGTHDQLIDKRGLYAELFTIQAKAYQQAT